MTDTLKTAEERYLDNLQEAVEYVKQAENKGKSVNALQMGLGATGVKSSRFTIKRALLVAFEGKTLEEAIAAEPMNKERNEQRAKLRAQKDSNHKYAHPLYAPWTKEGLSFLSEGAG
ncbi:MULTISPECIES: hypothetical protein [unclassified Neptuniibacter]|uniref:hypothetical protein n=1 Tax=unclassified Neptuniibacter TaxID=2630693 RepID=UPI000C3BA796|nr:MULTISPECIES: hypothetical protein [unclassified Neptuniibacter]MAY41700.1 hypothetical protein [Oceanospirillaceae bacterium]|tara:strand:- start:6748 stop:7098 length:351 start_codon:yes stop_codon:yes gene_type:complete